MYFSLRTGNDFLKEKVGQVISKLKETFGEEKIHVINGYELFVTFELHDIYAYVDFTNTHSLVLYDDYGDNERKVKIDLDLLDVIYSLEK